MKLWQFSVWKERQAKMMKVLEAEAAAGHKAQLSP